jgi:hypothetical protein
LTEYRVAVAEFVIEVSEFLNCTSGTCTAQHRHPAGTHRATSGALKEE